MELLSFLLTFLVYLLIASPVCLVLHELGHAAMILLLTRQNVAFQFGVRGARREIHIGRLSVTLYSDLTALFFCRYHLENKAALSRRQDFWITIAGPLMSLVFSIVFAVLWLRSNGSDPWAGLAIFNAFNFLNTAIPRENPQWQGAQAGIPNDGLQLVNLFKAGS